MQEEAQTIDQPLTAMEHTKLMIFFILMIPPIFLGVGILPVAFISFGIFMMKKNKMFSYIVASTRIVRGYLWLILIVVVFILGSDWIFFERNHDVALVCIGIVTIVFTYISLIKYLFYNPLHRHRNWVQKNGIFSSKEKVSQQGSSTPNIDNSSADELQKWIKLKEDGHITEEEFRKARDKLLNS